MTQRIRERLTGDNETLVRAYRTGEYTDQFTTRPQEDPKVTLERLPKCMQTDDKFTVKNIQGDEIFEKVEGKDND